MGDNKTTDKKKGGFWKALGNAAVEFIGNILYQGPR
jgi:hypothetical protein